MKIKIGIIWGLIASASILFGASPPPLRYNPVTTNAPSGMTNVIRDVSISAGMATSNDVYSATNILMTISFLYNPTYTNYLFTNFTDTATARIITGAGNRITTNQPHSVLVGGLNNRMFNGIPGAGYNFLGGGGGNYLDNSEWSVLVGGINNRLDSGTYLSMLGGVANHLDGISSVLVAGRSNFVSGDDNSVLGGIENSIVGTDNAVVGSYNMINIFDGVNSGVIVGVSNRVSASDAFTFGFNLTNLDANTLDIGVSNIKKLKFTTNGVYGDGGNLTNVLTIPSYTNVLFTNYTDTASARIITGSGNRITTNQVYSVLVGGVNNRMFNGLPGSAGYNFLGGGDGNRLDNSEWSVLVGGVGNELNSGTFLSMLGGVGNHLDGVGAMMIGGKGNFLSGADSAILGGISNNIVGDTVSVIGVHNAVDIFDGVSYGTILGASNKLSASDTFVVGSRLTNTVSDTIDIGMSDATKSTISASAITIRSPIYWFGQKGFSGVITNLGVGITNFMYFTNGILYTNTYVP